MRFRFSISIALTIAALTAGPAFAAAVAKVSYSGKTVKVAFTAVPVAATLKCTSAHISNPKNIIAGNEIVSALKRVGNTISFSATFKLDKDHPAHGTYKAIVSCFSATAMKSVTVPFVVNAK